MKPRAGIVVSESRDNSFCTIVEKLIPGGPGQHAGIAENDLILSLNGLPISSNLDFTAKIREINVT